MIHNMNTRVAKCPSCKTPIYKISGCNHMTCYRCNVEWCWICRRITPDAYFHFSPGNIFGCAGMQEIPQSIILYILLLSIQLLFTPFMMVGTFSYYLGDKFRCLQIDDEFAIIGAVFWYGVLFLPVVLVPTVLMLPIVLIYRIYVIVSIIVRNFFLCCCC